MMTWRDIYDADTCPNKSTVEYLDALQELVPMNEKDTPQHRRKAMNLWFNDCIDAGLVRNDIAYDRVLRDLRSTASAKSKSEE